MDEFDFEPNGENIPPNDFQGGDPSVYDGAEYAYGDGNEYGQGTVEQRDEYYGGAEDDEIQIPGVDDLPLFATAEARKIDLDNKANEAEIERVVSQIADLQDRAKIMKEHFKNVQQEVDHTNALYNAKKSEMLTETHMRQLTTRSLGRAQSESRKIQGELANIQEMINSAQNQLNKENERMDEFKMQMNWNQEELEKWVIASKQKEEDNDALQKYTQADDHKIQERTRQLEHLTKELLVKKAFVENEISDTQAKQLELDRLAIDFRDLHRERQALIGRWQEAIEEMKARDNSINELGERFSVAKVERAKKEGLLAIAEKRFQAQSKENTEVEQRSDVLSRMVSKKREDMLNNTRRLADFRDELESLKSELTAAAENLVTKRSENTHKAQDLDERKIILQRQRDKYQLVKQKLAGAKTQNTTSEQSAKAAEDELNRLEKEFEKHVLLLKRDRETLIKETQTLFDSKAEDARLRASIHGTKSAFRTMDVSLHALDKDAAKQQELLYNAEFQIQQIERKIARGMGERSDEEKKDLKRRTDELEAQKEVVVEKRKVLQAQVRKLANELSTSKMRREQLKEKETSKQGNLGELELENRMIEDDIKRETRVKEELVVNNDLLRLEVRRLRDLLASKADAVFSLENRKQQLELSLAERKEEIQVHREVLRAEQRIGQEEKHKVTMELRSREANVEKLRSRFEAVSKAKGSNDEGHSQAYFVILAAQKREGLQRRGDELDYDVRKCEKEIRALQTTLDHLNARNKAYRASFQKVELEGDDFEVLKQLEERLKLGKEGLFKKKKELQRLVTDVEEDTRRLLQISAQDQSASKQREHLENAKAQVEDEILSQEAQLGELADKIQRIVSKHRQQTAERLEVDVSTLVNGTIEEKAARAEVLKDVVQNVLYTLGQLSVEFPEVTEYLMSKTKEADLKVPMKPPSRAGNRSRASSRGGSAAAGGQSSALQTRHFDIEI